MAETSGSIARTTAAYRMPIRRPVTTAMIFLTLVVFGWKSYQELPISLMPDISYPTLTVRTEYEGAAPEDVEQLLTRPLEETLSIVSGMKEISSISSPGVSEIILEFTWDTDMVTAQQDVRDRLDLFEPPREVTEKPVILRYDPTLDPVMRVAITPPPPPDGAAPDPEIQQAELTRIREAAERHIKGDLEAEPGIAQVSVKGGQEGEIQIRVDSERLKNLGLSLDAVATALAQQNINLSGGSLKEGRTEYLVRTLNEFEDIAEIGQTPIPSQTGRAVRLQDFAEVLLGARDRDTVVRINGLEAVELEIYKEGDANTVDVANRLKDLLGFDRERSLTERLMDRMASAQAPVDPEDEARQRLVRTVRSHLPRGAQLTLISDPSRFIVDAIRDVQQSALVGGALALAILYLFLRDLRSTVAIGLAIPISVITAFVPMYLRGISLNIMSLGGLALGIGMLVDNSIVVLESIFRCREEGDGVLDGADRGTREVAGAVIASTLTTVAVFFPIAFVEGMAGEFFGDQALTVTFSLLASLVVALFLNPMLASRQGLTLERSGGAVGIVGDYLALRASGRSGIGAAFAAVPRAIGRARDALVDAAVDTASPLRGKGKWTPLLLLVLGPILVAVFLFRVLLMAVGAVLVALLLLVGLVALAVLAVVSRVLRIVLWLPLRAFTNGFNALREGYTVSLRRGLRFSPLVLAAAALVALHAAHTSTGLGRELIPQLKQGEFGIRMEAPPGTRLEETEARARTIEQAARALPEIESVAVQVGMEKTETSGNRGENIANFTVKLRDPKVNVARQDAIMENLRRRIAAVTPDEITFTLPTLFSFKTAVELQIRGDDLEELRRVGRRVLDALQGIEGLKDAELSVKSGYPEVIITLDRDLLAARGIAVEEVAQRLRTEVQGEVATRYDRGGEKIDVRVRADRRRLQSLQDLRALSVVDGTPPVPLSAVARIEVVEGPSEIRRIDQRQVALVTANVQGRDLGAVSADIQDRIRRVPKPADYSFVLGGQNRELQESYRSLIFALLLAAFLVYVVMASQFESLGHPALIMFSVPLAFVGVVYTLDFLAMPLSIVVFIGGIILAGIVVNNAIVLVDYINQLRGRGLPKAAAIVEAGRVRLRPILMTTLTTVLGLIPMALWSGEGAEMRAPLAVTLIAGLSSSTLLTLYIIPMLYYLFGGRDPAPVPVAPDDGRADRGVAKPELSESRA